MHAQYTYVNTDECERHGRLLGVDACRIFRNPFVDDELCVGGDEAVYKSYSKAGVIMDSKRHLRQSRMIDEEEKRVH